ncbi:MAG: SCP2 sterol-binding domain-containing protein [Deltaproteobacteria bacterium]|nr:SCP2 sterol-binding domain-containing protein [Deltaproteobacteria bacterium]
MTKTPGKCMLKDDMTEELFPKWLEADLVVYATPLFHHTVNATMKTFIERTFPICEPFLQEREKRWVHPLRKKHPAAVVLSVCGFPAMSAFGALSHYVKFLFEEQEEGRLWAEIYRPGSEYLLETTEKQKDIFDATRQAGRELVEVNKVTPETLARIEEPLIDNLSDFASISNCMWRTCIAEGVTRKKYTEGGMTPRPDSIETFMLVMSTGFNPEGAGDTKAVLQFEFTGSVEGSCHLIISDRTIKALEGKSETPDLIIKTPFDVWMDIQTGKTDGTEMFLKGKYEVEGNTDFLDMGRFFRQEE